MARPRVFISSTYFDLRVLRADLERFIKEMGYEPVLFERGHVPYKKDKALEDSCYREISGCDILVAVVGGKFGTQSKDDKHSITQKELKTAIECGKQVYIFVERTVYAEYRTYLNNKEVEGFKPSAVDDLRIFKFLEEIFGLPGANPVEPFEISENIVHYLREQWAGLFQRLLLESTRHEEVNLIEKLDDISSTLSQLVNYLSKERAQGDRAIKDILLSSHPVFAAIKKAAGIKYRVVFHSLRELDDLLSSRGYTLDSDPFDSDYFEFDNRDREHGIRIRSSVFDSKGKLKIFTPEEWSDDWVKVYPLTAPPSEEEEVPQGQDQVPF